MTVKLKGLNDAQKPETAIVDNDVSEIDPAEFLKSIATKNRDNDTSEVQSPSPTVDIEKFALINKINAGTLSAYGFLTVTKYSNKNRMEPSRFKCPFCGSHELTPYAGKDFVQWRCDCFGDNFKRNEVLLAKTFGLDVDADKAEIYRRVKEKMPDFDKPTESMIKPNVNVGMFADDTPAENNPKTDGGDISIEQQIIDDLEISNGGFEDLPVEEKRGIRDETARRLKIGATKSWYHPKMPNTPSTTRFICRLGDETDPPSYNAILTPAERRRVKPLRESYEKQGKKPPKWTDKSLTANSKLVFNPTAIDDNDGLLCVLEGEFDCASIVQATNFQVAACALGGAGLFKDFEARLSKTNNPPQVIVLFDRDAKSQTGQLEAPKLVAELAEMRIAAVAKFFEDVLSDDELKNFGVKVDANEILQKRGEEFLADVINRIIDSSKVELDALKEKFAAEKSSPEFKDVSPEIYHDEKSRPKNLSPEINALLEAVNGALDSSNVLHYVDKARISGLVCPDCGSGSHTHGTGALKFFDKPSPHVACYKCRFGADALKLFAMKHGRDTTGKNFFETLRAAADEFGVKYDPKIFELPTRPLTVEDHMTGDEVVDAWQGECGYIHPELYAEICAAKEFLTSLTPENLTAAVACSQPTKKRIALCTYFDFASTVAYTFWATLDAAIKNATAQVTESKSGFTATADVDARALATLDVKKLRKDVDRYADKLKKAHEKYQDNFQRNKQRAEHDKRVVARNKAAKAAIGDAYKLKDPAHANYLLSQENDDTGRAEQFAYLFGKSIRFIPKSERWLVFKRDSEFKSCGVWQLGNPGKNTIVMPYAAEMHKFLVANMSDNPDAEEKKAVEEWRNLKRMNNAVRLAGAGNHNNIQISADDLDTHPELLNCRNGVINLQTGEFFDRVDPTLLITQKCNAVWRGQDFRNADVDKFFHDVFTDVSTREALIRFLGYGITGDISAHVAHFWKGRGRNGKTTLLNLLFALLGGYAVKLATAAILDTGRPTDANNATTGLNPIRGARLAVFNELKPQDRLNAPLFKDLVGGDKINIRQLNCEYEEIKPTAKIIVCGNYHPKLDNNGDDDGLPSRIRAVPFTEQFTGDRCDPRLLDKLTTPEALSGLLALLVNAAQDFYRDGLLESSAMSTAKRKYLAENNFVAQFVEDNCVLGGEDLSIPRKQFLARLKSEYRADCDRYTDRALQNFVTQIQGVQYKTIGKNKVNSFVGIGWAGGQSDDYGESIQSSEDFLPPPN